MAKEAAEGAGTSSMKAWIHEVESPSTDRIPKVLSGQNMWPEWQWQGNGQQQLQWNWDGVVEQGHMASYGRLLWNPYWNDHYYSRVGRQDLSEMVRWVTGVHDFLERVVGREWAQPPFAGLKGCLSLCVPTMLWWSRAFAGCSCLILEFQPPEMWTTYIFFFYNWPSLRCSVIATENGLGQ